MRKPQTETKDIRSLFNEIIEIIGTDNLTIHKNPTGISIPQEPHIRNLQKIEESPYVTQRVCKNAEEGIRLNDAEPSVSKDTQLGNSAMNDVSPIVHKITEIVRDENGAISMEERLENLGFLFDSEIVEKVLMRCFKVRHLALKFFNWVKLRTGFCHTTKTYNTMIYIAGEAKEFNLVEKLLEEMEKNFCVKDIKTWTILISHYGKAKQIGKALMIFEKMRKSGCEPDKMAYKLIISALCTAGKPEIVMEFYKEMVHKDLGVDMNVYKLLLNCLSRSGDIAAVRLVADDMMKVSEIPALEVYSCMLKSFCISGRIREALELVRELKNKSITLDSKNIEILVKGLCRADRIADALELVGILKKNFAVDGAVYGIIINGCFRSNNISKAFDLFNSIKESGYLPTASTYTELMQYLFRSNEYQRACELYEEMLEKGVEPDTVAIMALVAGHVRHYHVSEAWKVFKSMKEKGIRATQKSYAVFIKELCRVSRTEDTFKVLNEMQVSKINIGDEIYHLVISSLEKKGEVDKLEKVRKMQRTCKLYPQEGQSICGRCNMVDDVSRLVELIQGSNSKQIEPDRADIHLVELLPKVYSDHDLHEICSVLSSSMDWCLIQEALEKCTVPFTPELVMEVLRRCQQHGHAALRFFTWVGQRAGYSHTSETYNMGIKISGCGKDFNKMRYLYLEMRRKGSLITSETWTIMIMQYGRAGLTEIALKKFEEMKANDCKPSRSTYKYLIIFLCGRKGRKVDKAIKNFHEMIGAGYVPDKELIEIYLACLCEVGSLSAARRCIEYLCKVGFTIPLSYSLLIRALCRAGRLEEALALIDEMGAARSTLDQYIYGSLVHALLRRGRLDDALAKVDAMKQVGRSEEALQLIYEMLDNGIFPSTINFQTVFYGLNREGEERRTHITQELINNSQLDKILQDRYGNYVIQVALNHSEGASYAALVEAVRPHVLALRTNP
ncbi:hypothetical protein HHK36_032717 [Tetracentron sinense]|uniref:Pentatricopeptide repeat-containing protein n=1 Tax=Tetracentron sinense TaxID=13715 RepID=A0A834Y9T4_TETSI|nr:hypothetical protein HHK36_032717 [Tetracentron sinense]